MLSVLLSQVLVAFTIELDNEFEARGAKTYARPFMTSLVMWSNFLRHVDESGTTVGAIIERSSISNDRTRTTIGGMERWGYLSVDHDPTTGIGPRRAGFGSGRGIKADTVIYPSMVGKLAKDIWGPLPSEIEERWRQRIGAEVVEALRDVLDGLVAQTGLVMPHFLPVVGGGWFAPPAEEGPSTPDRDLPALLSRVLLAFTLDAESDPAVPLPLAANVLRVLGAEGTPVKELPRAAGVSKEAVAMSLTWLQNAELVAVEPDPAARGKVARLTDLGAQAQADYTRTLDDVETAWGERYGRETVDDLRASLQRILDQPGGEDGPLSAGLVTPPGGWRSKARYKPLTAAFVANPSGALPHYPMVLHRGGWPDGS